jgi:uncharacterized membrane protein
MRQPDANNIDIVAIVLCTLAIIAFAAQAFIHQNNVLFETIYLFFFGLYLLYSGNKKFRAARIIQHSIRRYTQPGILFGIGMLLAIPSTLLNNVQNNANTSETIIAWLLFIPSLVLILAAAFFYFKRVGGKYRLK